MHRKKIGIAAALCLALAALLHWLAPEQPTVEYACWRIGAVLATLWLAYPQLIALPRWLVAGSLVLLLVAAWKPKVLWIALPLFALLALVRPRGAGPRANPPV